MPLLAWVSSIELHQDHAVPGKQQIPDAKTVTFDCRRLTFGINPRTWITDVYR
jgi:hypothetical protein